MKRFKLTRNKSTIKVSLDTPFNLDEDGKYMLWLDKFYSDNFIANINRDLLNSFRFAVGKVGYTFIIFRDNYSVTLCYCGLLLLDIEKRFKDCLKIFIDSTPEIEIKSIMQTILK